MAHDHIQANETQRDMGQRMQMGDFQEGSLRGVDYPRASPLLLYSSSPFPALRAISRSRRRGGQMASESQIMKDLESLAFIFCLFLIQMTPAIPSESIGPLESSFLGEEGGRVRSCSPLGSQGK